MCTLTSLPVVASANFKQMTCYTQDKFFSPPNFFLSCIINFCSSVRLNEMKKREHIMILAVNNETETGWYVKETTRCTNSCN